MLSGFRLIRLRKGCWPRYLIHNVSRGSRGSRRGKTWHLGWYAEAALGARISWLVLNVVLRKSARSAPACRQGKKRNLRILFPFPASEPANRLVLRVLHLVFENQFLCFVRLKTQFPT